MALFVGKQELNAWEGLASPLILLALAVISNKITGRAVPDDLPRPTESRLRLFLQLAVITTVIMLTGFGGMQAHGLLRHVTIPWWSVLLRWLATIGAAVGIGGNQTVNFGSYALIPGILALVLGDVA